MSVYEDTIVTKFVVDTTGLSEALDMQSLGGKLAKAQSATGAFTDEITKLRAAMSATELKAFEDGFDGMNKKIELAANRMDRSSIAFIYAGKELQNIGMTIERFLIPGLTQLGELNDEAGKKVMGVYAAFEFLKISMFETFAATPLFGELVSWLVQAAVWAAEFVQKYPMVAQMAAALGAVALALGTLAIGYGVFTQLEQLGLRLEKLMGDASSLGTTLAGLALIAIGAKLSYDEIKNGKFDLMGDLKAALITGLGVALVFNPELGALVFSIVLLAELSAQAIMDPAGFGKSLVDVANTILNMLDVFGELVWKYAKYVSPLGLIFAAWDSATGQMPKGPDLKPWFDKFGKGVTDEVVSLNKQGTLAPVLQDAYKPVIDNAKMFDDWSAGQKKINDEVAKSAPLFKNFGESLTASADAITAKLGNDGTPKPDTVMASFKAMNLQIASNTTAVRAFSNELNMIEDPTVFINVHVRQNDSNSNSGT